MWRSKRIERLLTRPVVRLSVGAAFLLAHLWIVTSFANERFGLPFNLEPGSPPAYAEPGVEMVPEHWRRLVVSRWDSAHYISLVLRGYSQCKKQDLTKVPIPDHCNFNFYPGYAVIGGAVRFLTRLPADYCLLGVSLTASLAFLFLWTDPVIVKALGLRATYVSLLAFNAFPNAFALVTTQTEPCTFAFTLASALALARRRIWLAAFLAGAASGMRVSGAAVGAAMGLAILCLTLFDRPLRVGRLLKGGVAAGLASWGLLAMCGYHWWVYRDPFLYVHYHAVTYGHSGSILNLLHPRNEWFLRSIDHPLHEGVVLSFSIAWLLLGGRRALASFSPADRVFWYALTVLGIGISFVGSLELSLAGMNRYLLLIFPLFFSIGVTMKNRPALLAYWLAISFWHYKQVDLCDFLRGNEGPESMCVDGR